MEDGLAYRNTSTFTAQHNATHRKRVHSCTKWASNLRSSIQEINNQQAFWVILFRWLKILWHVDPLLGNDSVNTFPRQRIRKQHLNNFRCYTRRCKYNSRARGVFMWFTYIHCWATDVFSKGPLQDYISGTDVNQIRMRDNWERERMRMERVLSSQGRSFRLKIVSFCNCLWLREILQEAVNKSNRPIQNPVIISHGAINYVTILNY
jgi:hypothetical protein